MGRRIIAYGAILVGLANLGILAVLLLTRPTPCPVTRAILPQINWRMTRVDVEKAIGVPPGDYSRAGARPTEKRTCTHGPEGREYSEATWLGNDIAIMVLFDNHDRVAHVWHTGVILRPEPSLLTRWRQRLIATLGL